MKEILAGSTIYLVTVEASRWDIWRHNYRFKGLNYLKRGHVYYIDVPFCSPLGMTIRRYFDHLVIPVGHHKKRLT